MRFLPRDTLLRRYLPFLCLGFFMVFCAYPAVSAAQKPEVNQEENQTSAQAPRPASRFEIQARASGPAAVNSGTMTIHLWAVEPVEALGPVFNIKARTALDNAIGPSGKVVCEVKSREAAKISAQCVNKQDQDLSLFMLQQGFVSVNRAAVYGTVFEDAYIQAEMQAQDRGAGLWAAQATPGAKETGTSSNAFMAGFGFVFFVCIVGAFAVLSIIIMRGFQKVIDAQNRNVDMMSKERKLRDKERSIVAIMLDSELKANKAKIEAYLVVYDEMLKSLKDADRAPKYRKAGDIIQKQPALSRSVFDRNTDKLDMLGGRLSSELVHFYARIKSNPEYVTLEPDTPIEQVVDTLEKSLNNARRMDQLAHRLLESFANSGIISEDFQEYNF